MAKQNNEDFARSMREITQKKFLQQVIDSAANWKVLVMDDESTRIISSTLTMFDIMEKKVTIVENLSKARQPFPEMDVVYFITPTEVSVKRIIDDFAVPSKPKYGFVHVVFTDVVSNDLITLIQDSPALISRIKTFKEVNLDYLVSESNVFHFDMGDTLGKLYGSMPDPTCPTVIGRKLASLCITLNEHPSIRYQGSSPHARNIANALDSALKAHKKSNSSFWCHGDDIHQDRERGQILILDRSFDPLSPLMHEFTYQSMVNDLLPVTDGIVEFKTDTNKGESLKKKAILNDNDELWVEFRHSHIASVIKSLKERMNDVLQNSAGAALAKKKDMAITDMSAAVKEIPEYQQMLSKLSQHVDIAQQCMNTFTKQNLLTVSDVEQTVSTGTNDEGVAVNTAKLVSMVTEAVSNRSMPKEQKIRLLAIYFITHRNASPDEKRQLCQAAGITGVDQQTLLNFDRLANAFVADAAGSGAGAADKKGGVFSFFTRQVKKIPATTEGEYTDTRHVPTLKTYIEQLVAGTLPSDKFPAAGPSKDPSKGAAKSVRRMGGNTGRWAKSETQFDGGRTLVFVAGGLSYSELKVGYELMAQQKKEVVMGATSLLSPDGFVQLVANMNASNTKSSDGL